MTLHASNGEGKQKLVLAFMGVNTAAVLGLAGWLLGVSFRAGEYATRIEVNTRRLDMLERQVGNMERTGTAYSHTQLDDVIQRLKDLDAQIREHRRGER